MATINSTADNCVLYNIMSNAAKLPGYQSQVNKLNAFVNVLPQSVANQYYTKSRQIIDSKKYTANQFAEMYNQKIIPLINNSNNENEFSSKLLELLDTL